MYTNLKYIHVRKNLPAWEIPYLIKLGAASIVDGIVVICTLGKINTRFGLDAARDLSGSRIKRLQK